MFETKRSLEEAILALRYPKIAIEYVKGLNKYYKYLHHCNKKIEKYQEIKENLGVANKDKLKLLSPKKLEDSGKELSFNIRRFVEFYEGFLKVNDSIKPVMLYYGMQYLFSSISRSFLKFDNIAPHHGITVQKGSLKEGNPETITIKEHGHFSRTVDTFYILDAASNIFSLDEETGISYHETVFSYVEDDHTIDKNSESIRVFKEGFSNLKYSNKPKITMKDLIRYVNAFEYVTNRPGGDQTNKTNLVLLDYLILGITCNASRYHPEIWVEMNKIDSDYKFFMDKSQNRIENEWIPRIIGEYLFPIASTPYLKETELSTILDKRFTPVVIG